MRKSERMMRKVVWGWDRRAGLLEVWGGMLIATQVQAGPLWTTVFQENVLTNTRKGKNGMRT